MNQVNLFRFNLFFCSSEFHRITYCICYRRLLVVVTFYCLLQLYNYCHITFDFIGISLLQILIFFVTLTTPILSINCILLRTKHNMCESLSQKSLGIIASIFYMQSNDMCKSFIIKCLDIIKSGTFQYKFFRS